MSDRSELISRLLNNIDSRTAYIKAKLGILVPSQIRALRLKSDTMPRQSDLARVAGLHQSRISKFETPGDANVTLETLARLAAALKVGLVVKFVPFSEMLRWENGFSQDQFDVARIEEDTTFCTPELEIENQDVYKIARAIGTPAVDTAMMDVTSPIAASASTIPNPQMENVGGQYPFRLFSGPVPIRSGKSGSCRRVAQPRSSTRQRKRA